MEQTFVIATAITSAVFQTVKQVDVNDRFNRFYALAVLGLGFGVGLLFKFDIVTCIVVGLAANGTYSVVKMPVKMGIDAVKKMI